MTGPVGGPSTDIYVGTDKGVYISRDGGANWQVYGTGFPQVSVFGLEIQNQSRIIRAATHGRGMYETFVAFQPATPLVSKVVSRKGHGGAGNFDVFMPQTGNVGIDPRRAGAGDTHTIVLTFGVPVTSGSASVTAGDADVIGTPTFSGNEMTVQLGNVANAQEVTLTVTNVTSSTGVLNNASVDMAFLLGDINADRATNSGDATVARNNSGKPADDLTFRSDVNTDGTVNSGDAFIVRSRSGTASPPLVRSEGVAQN